jgi:hypothetical protein
VQSCNVITKEGTMGILKGLGWLRGISNISSVSDLDRSLRVTPTGVYIIFFVLHSFSIRFTVSNRYTEVLLFVWMLLQLLWAEKLFVQSTINTCICGNICLKFYCRVRIK